MKLAEALILRADCQKKIAQLKDRLIRSAKVQEGDEPPENPAGLILEIEQAFIQLLNLIQKINQTNSTAQFNDQLTMSDALAMRDTLILKRNLFSDLVQSASVTQNLYSRTEIKFASTVNIKEIQKQLDQMARDYRQLDTKIQEMNWNIDLIE
jgi:hypothetical protein